jgi:hypothetical protein
VVIKHIGGVKISVLASSTVDSGFEPPSSQTKDNTIGIDCFSAKNVLWLPFGVSEWLLFNTKFSNFSAISWREPVNFQWNDDEVRFVRDQHALLDLYSASSLKQQSAVNTNVRFQNNLWNVQIICLKYHETSRPD